MKEVLPWLWLLVEVLVFKLCIDQVVALFRAVPELGTIPKQAVLELVAWVLVLALVDWRRRAASAAPDEAEP